MMDEKGLVSKLTKMMKKGLGKRLNFFQNNSKPSLLKYQKYLLLKQHFAYNSVFRFQQRRKRMHILRLPLSPSSEHNKIMPSNVIFIFLVTVYTPIYL